MKKPLTVKCSCQPASHALAQRIANPGPLTAAGCCLLLLLAAHATTRLQAATINTGPSSLFPSAAEVIAAKPSDPGITADTAVLSLAQTFQTGSAFDLQRIYIRYRTGGDVSLSLFAVSDVNAATHDEPPTTLLFSETLALPATASALTAEIVLDTPFSIAASTGTEGYALRFSGNPAFEWWRTGATAGSVYPGGRAYEDGSEKSGSRDFVLALTTIPEPSVLALMVCGAATLWAASRSRRVS